MKQVSCPHCNAPMWEGGRCPWNNGSGCGRRLRITKPQATRRIVVVKPKRAKPAPVARVLHTAICHPDRKHYGKGKCRQCWKREQSAARRAANPVVRPVLSVTCRCGTVFETVDKRKKNCSERCRDHTTNRYNYRKRTHNRPRVRRVGRASATCHPDRELRGHGLCQACYQRQWDHAKNAKASAA